MAKFEEADEDVVKIFDEVRYNTTIHIDVQFTVICNNKQKTICKLVKSSDLVELLTEGLNFAMIINEVIFNELPADMKRMVIDEALAGVNVNENGIVSDSKPDFSTHTGILQKYGGDKTIVLHESIKTLYTVQKQKEDEAKAQTKTKKSRKPKESVE
jgi:hypothetical protein